MEDAQIVEVLKSSPLSSDEVRSLNLQSFFVENQDEFVEAYTIISEKGKWKCNCPWGTYQSDRKACWHVNEIPNVMLQIREDDMWAEFAEEAATIRKEQMK